MTIESDDLDPLTSITDGRLIGAPLDTYELLQEADSLLSDPSLPIREGEALPAPWRISAYLRAAFHIFVIIAANGNAVGRIYREADATYIVRVLNELRH